MRRALIAATLSLCSLAGCGGGAGTSAQTNPLPTQNRPISNVAAFMGDSITHRWDLSQYDPGPTLNFGVDGDITPGMLARFQSEVIANGPGVVVILGGVNDFINFGVAGTNTDSIKAMAAEASAAGIRVILCSVIPISEPMAWATNADIEAFNQQIIELARANGYLYADYYDAMVDAIGGQNTALFTDFTHPNAAGYAVMWKVLAPLLQEDGL